MIKPKPIPKKGKGPVQKQQRISQPKNLLRQKKDFFPERTVLLIIILIITFIAFLPSLSNQFIKAWDDNVYITDNPMITHLNWESIKGFFTAPRNGTYVPVPLISWALEFKLFGLNPFPYHLNNLLIHLLCTSLVFYFFILLRLPVMYAALGALLFGIHPMRVESVAWVTERKDLLFCVFYLGSLIAYIKYILSENRKPMYFLLTLLLFVFSLFSKIQAVSLPLSILLLDYWFDRPLKLKLLWEKIPFFVLSLGFGLAGYFILQHLQVIDIHDKYIFYDRILLGLYSLSAYIVKLIVPLNLSIYYPYPVDPGESLPVLYYLNPVFLIIIALLIFLTNRKTKAVVFGVLFFLFNVMFLLQFVRAGQAYQADRFTYVSYIGLFFLAAWAAHKLANRNKSDRMVIAGLAVVVTAFFFSNTYARCKDWKDSITIWSDVIEKFPSKIPTAYYNRGLAYSNLGQWDKAIADYSNAIGINPKYTDAYSNRGIAYKNLGQWDKAIADYSRAIEMSPKYDKAWYNRGLAYYTLGRWDMAIADYSEAIGINPEYTEAYNNRGVAYNDLGQWDKAIADYSRAIGIDPDYKDAYSNRGIAFRNHGEWDKAIADFSRVIEIYPKYTDAYNNRGIVYSTLGQWDKAIADYSMAIAIDPKYMDAYSNRGISYGHLGQWDKAIADFSRQIELDRRYPDGYNNLGNAYFFLGQWEKAIAEYSRAIGIDPKNTNAYYNRDIAYKKLLSEKKR
jgi:tetratricopeptide (TPR) repeat protein